MEAEPRSTIHIIGSSRRYCARCGVPLPEEVKGRHDLSPGLAVAQHLAGSGVVMGEPERLAAEEPERYILCDTA